jgi:uncharacterized protein YgiM (DUF1202 family)
MKTLEQKLFDGAIWLLALSVLLVILTACSPVIAAPATATAEPSATAEILQDLAKSPTPAPDTCQVSTGFDGGRLNVRRQPGTGYAVIAVLREGDTLRVIERGDWLRVRTARNITGWINGRYCR